MNRGVLRGIGPEDFAPDHLGNDPRYDGMVLARNSTAPGGVSWSPGYRYLQALGSRLEVAGHSLMTGGGASVADKSFPNLLAGMMRANCRNIAQFGSVACVTEVTPAYGGGFWNGGVGRILQMVYPVPHQTGFGEPYAPPNCVSLISYGNNDIGYVGSLPAFLDAMRTIISRYITCVVIENDDLTTWTAAQGTGWGGAFSAGAGQQSGSTVQAVPNATGVNSDRTWTTPADWTSSGTLAFGFTLSANPTGTVTFAIDGTTVATLNFANHAPPTPFSNVATRNICIVQRIPVPAGSGHVVKMSVTATPVANAYFDYMNVEASPAPIVLVCNMFRTGSYTLWPNPSLNDDLINQWNQGLQQMLVNEFPATVLIHNIDAAIHQNPKYLAGDNVHPDDEGHAQLARSAFDTLSTLVPANIGDGTSVARTARRSRDSASIKVMEFGGSRGYTTGNATLTTTAFADITHGGVPAEVAIMALPGDQLELAASAGWNNDATNNRFTDVAVMGTTIGSPTWQSPAFTTATTGGTITGNTTRTYAVTALNAAGETLASSLIWAVVPAGTNTNTVTIKWNAVTGATAYKVYFVAGAATSGLLQIAAPGNVSTYTDTVQAPATSGTFPLWNTTAAVQTYVSSGTATALTDGISAWRVSGGSFGAVGEVPFYYTVQKGDLQSGYIILRFRAKLSAAGSSTITCGANDIAQYYVRNTGPQGVP